MAAPPLFSTFSAVTELVVTAAVVWFFYRAMRHQDYRWVIITLAVLYETLFNITYMVSRLGAHTGPDVEHPAWYIGFVAFHGTLSLVMFIGLIALVLVARSKFMDGDPHPLGKVPRLTYTFLALWGVSILTGEIIYILQWTTITTA